MKLEAFHKSMIGQFDAALAMLRSCITKCPDDHWDGLVGTRPFWMVALHSLRWTDLYAAKDRKDWTPSSATMGPQSLREIFDDEFPNRLTREQILAYLTHCRKLVHASIKRETNRTLEGPSGFAWIQGPRAEAHFYNLRHLAHHVGQLSASLRRVDVETKWSTRGFR